eukprot:298118-Amorphochlora_amoeboformis.AAC.1
MEQMVKSGEGKETLDPSPSHNRLAPRARRHVTENPNLCEPEPNACLSIRREGFYGIKSQWSPF